ncbi:DUF624 domain-containing protein [Bacillus sp. JJ1566]|uniref:DUF624 domain-containing protein n=1 Tax=Bacillus sp. JJ1566 TaxID=3122961 RepID=UPI0030007974
MLSISKLLVKTGNQIFTNITKVLGVSVLWSLLLVPAIFILPLPSAIVYLFLTLFPATVAVLVVMKQVIERKRIRIIPGFFSSFVRFYKRSLFIGFFYLVAILIPVSTWWYYFEINGGYGLFIFSIFQTYFCFMFLVSQVYAIPLLVSEDSKMFTVMNKSIRIFMAKPVYSFGLFIQIASITVLLSLTIIGFLLLYVGIMAVFTLNAAANIQLADRKTERTVVSAPIKDVNG